MICFCFNWFVLQILSGDVFTYINRISQWKITTQNQNNSDEQKKKRQKPTIFGKSLMKILVVDFFCLLHARTQQSVLNKF